MSGQSKAAVIKDATAVTALTSETILVVEDDEQVRRYTVETLVDLNYQVFEACDADEAVDMFNHHGRAILLLTDVIMPGRNGRILSEKPALGRGS